MAAMTGNNNQNDGQRREHAEPPKSLKGLVACRACAQVKTYRQFYEDGCDNCDPTVLDMREDPQRCKQLTTPFFDGVCGIFDPASSWVARYEGFDSLKPGLYALKVNEELDPETKRDLLRKKIPFLRTELEFQNSQNLMGRADADDGDGEYVPENSGDEGEDDDLMPESDDDGIDEDALLENSLDL